MSADMLIATIATPATLDLNDIDFAAGLTLVTTISPSSLFDAEAYEYVTGEDYTDQIEDVELVELATSVITDLRDGLESDEVDFREVAGYRLYISGGLSHGDSPTDAAEAIWNASQLPAIVLRAMGFVPDCSQPLARKNGLRTGHTDTDIVDAIALGLGTSPEWSGAETLEWIANTISKVREHPGDADPVEYLERWTEQYDFDPTDSRFLTQFVSEEASGDDVEDEDED